VIKRFYSDVLGLDVKETPEGLEVATGADSKVFIYPSETNKLADFTVLNFIVDDVEGTVGQLTQKGVRMEHYDMPKLETDKKGILRSPHGPSAIAWFKDPAQNILAVLQES